MYGPHKVLSSRFPYTDTHLIAVAANFAGARHLYYSHQELRRLHCVAPAASRKHNTHIHTHVNCVIPSIRIKLLNIIIVINVLFLSIPTMMMTMMAKRKGYDMFKENYSPHTVTNSHMHTHTNLNLLLKS